MLFTQLVETWINQVEARYLADINSKLEQARKYKTDNLDDYLNNMLEQMEVIREEYCSGYLGYSMICWLHQEFAKATDNQELCTVEGQVFHVGNTSSPRFLHENHPEELDQYINLFVKLSKESGRIVIGKDVSEELLRARFTQILRHNQYVGPRGGIVDISRQSVIDICIYLGWRSDAANFLLLRMEDSCLSVNSVSDVIARFVLDVPGATLRDRHNIHAAYRRLLGKKKGKIQENNVVGTKERMNWFERILQSGEDLKTKRTKYVKALIVCAAGMEQCSVTARDTFERILRIAYVRMGNRDQELEARYSHLPKNINLVITDDTIPPLGGVEKTVLIDALLSNTFSSDLSSLVESLSSGGRFCQDDLLYPVIEEKQIKKQPLGERWKRLLHKDLNVVEKKDILFAYYLMESVDWDLEPLDSVEKLQKRYDDFKSRVNDILQYCFLPRFYPIHLLEFTISKAMMSNFHVADVFLEVMDCFELSSEDHKKNQKQRENKINKEKISPEAHRAFNNLFSKMSTRAEKLKAIKYDDVLFQELSDVAKKLYKVWAGINFAAMDVRFELPEPNAKASFEIDQSDLEKGGIRVVFSRKGKEYQTVMLTDAEIMLDSDGSESYIFRCPISTGLINETFVAQLYRVDGLMVEERICENGYAPGQIGIKVADTNGVTGYRTIWRLSHHLCTILHEPDSGNELLKSLSLPGSKGNTSVAELASGYIVDQSNTTLLNVLEKNEEWNIRLRRKTLLIIMKSMILNLYGLSEIEGQYKVIKKRNKAKDQSDDAALGKTKKSNKIIDIYPGAHLTMKFYDAKKDLLRQRLEEKMLEN